MHAHVDEDEEVSEYLDKSSGRSESKRRYSETTFRSMVQVLVEAGVPPAEAEYRPDGSYWFATTPKGQRKELKDLV